MENKQITSLTVIALTGKMILSYPRMIIELAGSSAWISLIIYTAAALGLFILTNAVYKTKDTIIGIADKLSGAWLRIITGILVFIVILFNAITIFAEFPDIIRLVLLQKTYVEFIAIAFFITAAVGAFCGIEAVGRVSVLFLPICGVVFILFLILLIPGFDIENITPIFGNGFISIFGKGAAALSLFSDILLLNILLPHLKIKSDYKKSGIKAILIGGISAVLITAVYSLCYPYPASVNFLIPIYQLERLVHLSSFFSRFEAVLQMFWTILILLYAVLNISVLSEILQAAFNSKTEKIYIIPVTLLIMIVSMLPQIHDNIYDIGYFVMQIIYIPVFVLPIVYGLFHVKHYGHNFERKQK